MRRNPGPVWVVSLALLVLLSLAFGSPALSAVEVPALSSGEVPALSSGEVSQGASDPVIDLKPMYLPVLTRNHPNLFPPPIQAIEEGWLRKWQESQTPDRCLQASGTPYYLESEPGAPGWLAAVVETVSVTESELEVHIDDKVAVTGRVEYFDPTCSFPRLYADRLEVIIVAPDGHGDRLDTGD